MPPPDDDEDEDEARLLLALDDGLTFHLRPVDVLAVLRAALDAAGAAITVATDPAPLPPALADPARLQEALAHLLDHALAHGPITAARVHRDRAAIQITLHHDGGPARRSFHLLLCRTLVEAQGGYMSTAPSFIVITFPASH